jgi:ADP-heptose:LPS heptosyltransferase
MGAANLLTGARLFIGNDSGLGHLASAVGTATLTIYVKPASNLSMWRPGWARGEVLVPKLKLWSARAHRRSMVSVETATNAALAMLAEDPRSRRLD